MGLGRIARQLFAFLLACMAVGCATYDSNVVVNPVLATTRMTIAENIERKGAFARQTGFVSLYLTELGAKRFLAIVTDSREEGEDVRVVLLEAEFEIDADSMNVTLLGDAGKTLAFVIPGAANSGGTVASESFSKLDLEFMTRQGTTVELEFDFDFDGEDGRCTIEHARRTSDGFLGMFAAREDRRAVEVALAPARAGRETELWIGDASPAPPPPPPKKPATTSAQKPPGKKPPAKPPVKSPAKPPAKSEAPAKPPAKSEAPAKNSSPKKPPAKSPPAKEVEPGTDRP